MLLYKPNSKLEIAFSVHQATSSTALAMSGHTWKQCVNNGSRIMCQVLIGYFGHAKNLNVEDSVISKH
jgi:hypothetical protein